MGNTLALQYKMDGHWRDRSKVDIRDVRAYELFLLRRKSDRGVPETDTCNNVLSNGTSEISAGRQRSGKLAGVTACLQMLAIRPMHASESWTQVFLLVRHFTRLHPDLHISRLCQRMLTCKACAATIGCARVR